MDKKEDAMKEAVIVSACRTAVGRAKRGSLVDVRPEDMGKAVVVEALKRAGNLDPALVDDCIMGCAMPEAQQGMNIARQIWLHAKLPESVPCKTVNRFCSSGLDAIAQAAERIMVGAADIVVAGGVETMSMIPMGGNKIVPHFEMATEFYPAYVGMGETAENVAKRYNISRHDQDVLALRSNLLAIEANEKGYFKEQIVPLRAYKYEGTKGKRYFTFEVDEGPRKGTTLEGLAKLKPAFWKNGTVTAGNSSQMSDGAAAVVLMSREKAKEMGLKPMAKFIMEAVAGCGADEMGVGPSVAIPLLMKKTGMSLEDIDVIELNEAFASQAVYCVRKLGIEHRLEDRTLNPNGGAIALGHPLGCTGAKLTVQVVYHLRDHNMQFGVVSMCIGGGMGAAALFERVE
jgi:acetyl-CoA acyltransferase